MSSIAGFRFAATSANIKKNGAPDLALAVADAPATAAAVFTRNIVRAAPVEIAAERVKSGLVRAVLVNSGNANACTGQPGVEATLRSTRAIAEALGIPESQIFPASTGVIGQVLPAERIEEHAPELCAALVPENSEAFANAIRTTDRWSKMARASVETAWGPASLLGIGKGAGMIHPNLGELGQRVSSGPPHATMLAFLFTDAKVEQAALQQALNRAVDLTFNACSVDGDTSTNDTVLALASGASGHQASAEQMEAALIEVCRELARSMVLDGEGAEHAVDIVVRGLQSEDDARKVARTVATSMLVKTALFGKDANWGRLLAAAGRAEVPFDPAQASVYIGDELIVHKGLPVGAEAEAHAAVIMQEKHYTIELVLGEGEGRFSYLTCDIGHGYVDVNAGYRS